MAFGEILGYPPGSTFESKRELAICGLHNRERGGIAGRQEEGAESIVLNGGYPDDEDGWDVIIYTGQGGQDAIGRHVQHQELVRGNRALVTSEEGGLPVRVIRGPNAGAFATEAGYRYDGLYLVESHWPEISRLHGYRIWRFRLVRLTDTGTMVGHVGEQRALYVPSPRSTVTVSRVIRDTAITRQIKRIYDYRCQVCGVQLDTPPGPYAEAAHIRPLGRPHNGPDVLENVLCLCPNHHVLFDRWQLSLADDLTLVGGGGRLRTHRRHAIAVEHVRYHRARYEAAHAA